MTSTVSWYLLYTPPKKYKCVQYLKYTSSIIFNFVLASGIYPTALRVAKVILFFKKGAETLMKTIIR